MSLNQVIKQVAMAAVEASYPVAVMSGSIVNTNPLEVRVEQRFSLSADFLIVPESLKDLKQGDKLILLRVQGGQQFVLLDKVVDL